MNTTLRYIFFLLCLVCHAFAFDWQTDVNSGSFTSESHPSDSNNVRKEGESVGFIQNGSWIAFSDFDFGGGVEYLWIEAATAGVGGTVEFRLGSASGTLIGSVPITSTGDSNTYKPFALKISSSVTGTHHLFLKFTGGTGTLFNLAKFRFQRLAPDYKPTEPIVDWDSPVLAADMKSMLAFSTESHPTDGNNIRREFGRLAYIRNGNWISYKDFDFGSGVDYFSVLGGAFGPGGNVEVRLGSSTGTLVGTATITDTGHYDTFRTFATPLTQTVTGVNDLYLRFTGGGGYLFNVASFRFSNAGPVAKSYGRSVAADQLVQESNPGSAPVVPNNGELGSITNGSWVSYGSFDFGTDSDLITLEAATPGKGGLVEVRTGSETGPVVATVKVTYTGSWTHFRPCSSAISPQLSGTQSLYFKFIDPYGTGGDLFNLRSFAVGKKPSKPTVPAEGSVYVYPPVPGLVPSPYYTYSVQKVSALNNAQKELATNWMSPFAWFTECPEPGSARSLANTAYFDEYIGGWSHTYCNFELDGNTPIVVKITRNTVSGAPSGPIFLANVHPAHKVISCEIINGDVYVTMKDPALVTVDIDGQLDNRDAPRAVPDVWNSSTAPYKSKQKGSHAVSIFANPMIQDKPTLDDPSVRVIEPGDPLPLPDDQAWTTLYFKPGIHNLAQDANGQERDWIRTDRYPLKSNKNYYLPGDAIVYGNLYGSDGTNENIRIFGHGTLSGFKMPHFQDYKGPDVEGDYITIRMMNAMNCNIQGITIADPAEHTVYLMNNHLAHVIPNSMRWYKSISWRVNNDTGSAQGVMEDCFFRHQDDGIYYSAKTAVRRCTYWSDVNGSAFRGSFSTRDGVPEVTTLFPRDVVFEDCDIIYARGVFLFSFNSNGVITGTDGNQVRTYSDGTVLTGQHLVFRNFRMTDPRPVRTLFGFSFGSAQPGFLGMAGLRFENVESRHPQTWGWPNYLQASEGGIKNWYMDRVSINGQTLDSALLANNSIIKTSNVSEMVFGDSSVSPSTFNLQANTTGGSVTFDPPGGVYPLGTVVTVTAIPFAGQVFSGWGGNLSGSTNPTTITMTANKSITANINTPLLARTGWVATASASGGGGSPASAIDGVTNTRWATGSNQTTGQWFRVDMGSTRSFDRIVLDCSGAAGDYPRGYQVHVSNDGSDWGSPVATGTGSSGATSITFAAQTARYIRVTQSGSASGIWWSIHEFNVYEAAYTLNENSANGSVIFDPPGATYLADTVVTVMAVPDPGYVFTGWSGDLAGTTSATTLTMNTNKSVIANFSAQSATYTLTATSTNGAVTFNPPGPTYPINTVVTVTAIPDSGNLFTGWGGELTGTTNPATITMTAHKNISANMDSPVLPRTGWVASASSANGSPANAIDGNIGTRWSTGANQANGQWFRVDMGSAQTFNRIALDAGSSAGDYPRGYQVHVSNDGVNWGSPVATGTGSSGVTTITFDTQTARFIRVIQTGSVTATIWWSIHEFNVYGPAYTLTDTSPNGAVIFNPPGPIYLAGTVVTVTAVPDPNDAFIGWGGDLTGTTNPTTVTINGNTSITANFTPATYTLSTSATNGLILSDPPGGVQPPGTPVTLTPTPAPGYQFSSWSGDLSGNENPAILTISGNKSVTANFWQPTQVTIDTTGGTTVLNYDAPSNTYIGNGTLQVSNNGSGSVSLGTDGDTNPTVFAMTGGLITIDSGVTFANGGWSKGIWTNNKADMQVNGTLDVSNGNPVIVNSLNGAGAIILSDVSSSRATELHVGVLGASGTFSGTIQEPHPGGSFVRIVKQGSGTQTFDNLENQKSGEIVLKAGVFNLSTASDIAFGANISGAGSLRKSGVALLTLSGVLTHTGDTTVEDGVLSIVQPDFANSSTVRIGLVGDSPAVLDLPNYTIHIIDQLVIDGVVQLGNGAIYDSLNSSGAITGLGKIQVGIAPTDYAAWVLFQGVIGDPADDDDNDGLTNYEEYAFGLLPKNGSSANPISIPFSAVSGTFSYTRRKSALTPPLSYTVWYSISLEEGNWIRDTGALDGTPLLDGEVETVPVTISPALLNHPKLFIQVRAE